jgi:hypothetical protein
MNDEKLVDLIEKIDQASGGKRNIHRYSDIAQAITSAGYVRLSQEEREALIDEADWNLATTEEEDIERGKIIANIGTRLLERNTHDER